MSRFEQQPALPARFADFYRPLLGGDIDAEIRALLEGPREKVARAIFSRSDFSALKTVVGEFEMTLPKSDKPRSRVLYDDAMMVSNEVVSCLSRSTAFEQGKFYLQSFPSYFVIRMLPIAGAEYVLDLCASPGGKALHCYDRMERQRPVIVNEPAGARRMRLASVLRTYGAEGLPVLGIDGGLVCQFLANEIPLIVLDAPCSGEAHILTQPQRRREWTPKQTMMLARRQLGLLSAAVHALRPGGVMLYSTCALSPYENELLIHELLERMEGAVEPMRWPEEGVAELQKLGVNYKPIEEVTGRVIDPRIVETAWRFRPVDFGEPFFGILLTKKEPTMPKKPIEPYPMVYEKARSKDQWRNVRVGPGRREFIVPAQWPELPGLPYLHLGR
jgi:16S rRNA C967 or C1407 C5-methylase (RsmB/RsmF family)